MLICRPRGGRDGADVIEKLISLLHLDNETLRLAWLLPAKVLVGGAVGLIVSDRSKTPSLLPNVKKSGFDRRVVFALFIAVQRKTEMKQKKNENENGLKNLVNSLI